MKTDKFITPIIAVSAIAMILFITDLTSYARGKKSYLLGTRFSEKSEIGDRLNDISNQITALTTRIAQLENSISQIDDKFQSKLDLQDRKSISDYKNMDKTHDHHKHLYGNKRYSSNWHPITAQEEPSASEDTNESESSTVSSHHENEDGYHIDNDFDSEQDNLGYSRRFRDHNKFEASNIRKYGSHIINPRYRPLTSRFPTNSSSIFESKRNSHYEKPNSRMGYTYGIPKPNFGKIITEKIDYSVEAPIKRINPAALEMPIKIEDILPNSGDNDSIVEVKKFGDLKSFSDFNKDMEMKISRPFDNSKSTFFKMSDILNSTPAHKPKPITIGTDENLHGVKGSKTLTNNGRPEPLIKILSETPDKLPSEGFQKKSTFSSDDLNATISERNKQNDAKESNHSSTTNDFHLDPTTDVYDLKNQDKIEKYFQTRKDYYNSMNENESDKHSLNPLSFGDIKA